MTPSAADLLASESLLFAVEGVVLGIWYPEIEAATDIPVPDHLPDAGPQRAVVGRALKLKSVPLCVVSYLIVAVYGPNSVQVVIDAVRSFWRHRWSAFADYDAVQTSLVLVTVLATALAVYLTSLALDLRKTKKKLQG